MQKGSHPGKLGNDVFKQAEAFGDQFRAEKGISRDVPTWASKAANQFITDRIGHATDDDLKVIDRDIKALVNDAAEFAKNSPEPDLSELWTDIYA